jgi:hypothetical protein
MSLKEAEIMAEQVDQPINLDDLQTNQEVFGSDGEKIGYVEGIFEDIETGQRYLEASSRVLHNYYIPEDEIRYAVMGRPVILKVTHDEVKERFRHRPKAV